MESLMMYQNIMVGKPRCLSIYFQISKYPESALKNKVEGVVYIKFIVRQDGTVSNPEVLKVAKELNDEALRVIKSMPKWKAGRVKGKSVDSYMTIPISFKLS